MSELNSRKIICSWAFDLPDWVQLLWAGSDALDGARSLQEGPPFSVRRGLLVAGVVGASKLFRGNSGFCFLLSGQKAKLFATISVLPIYICLSVRPFWWLSK